MAIVLALLSQVPYIAALPSWGRLSDRCSNKTVIALCGPLVLLCLAGWCVAQLAPSGHTLPLLVLVQLVLGLATSGLDLACNNIAFKVAPRGEATVYLGAKALGQDHEGLLIQTAGGERQLVVPAERILVTVGRKPQTEGWGLDQMALAMDGRFVRVDERCATSTTNVWAIGDLVGEPMLAHKASAQGEMVAEIIAGKRRHFTPNAIPAVCFTDPEVVVVGMTPQEAARLNVDCIGASFPFAANGRAMTLESTDGFVRVVARKDNHVIVGWQAVGGAVSELSTAFVQSIEMGAQLEDVAGTIHAHPTLGEAVQEAALRALGRALHI